MLTEINSQFLFNMIYYIGLECLPFQKNGIYEKQANK